MNFTKWFKKGKDRIEFAILKGNLALSTFEDAKTKLIEANDELDEIVADQQELIEEAEMVINRADFAQARNDIAINKINEIVGE